MKIIINTCYGKFTLSKEVCQILNCDPYDDNLRTNSKLIRMMEKKGSKYCSGKHSDLKVVEIPDDVKWQIEKYNGMEWISEVEVYRIWR